IHETDPDYHPTLEEAIEFYAPEYREMVSNAVQASLEEGKTFDFEAEIITRRGRRKWVRALGQPELKDGRAVKLFGTFQEITDIKKAELKLRETEERFSLAMRGSNDGFSDWTDVSSDKIWWSPRFFELLGYKPFEFQPTMGKFKELLHPEDHKKVSQAIEDHFENDNDFDVEYRLLHKSGEYRWFHARGETQRDEEGKPVRMSGAVRDITIRKQTEMALKQSERNLRMLFEQMVSGFAQLEMTTGPEEETPDFKYLDVNSAFERIVGLKKSDLVGKTIREVYSETEQYWLDFFREVVLNRQPAKLVDYHKDTDKYYEVIAYSPKENHLATIMTDITERKKAELRIRDSEERLNQIIMGNAVATFVIDKNHRITHWNHACEKLTGMSRYEVIGTDRQWEAFYTEKRPIMADLLIDGLPEDEIARHYSESFRRSSLISGAYESEEYFSELQKEGIWIYITTAPIRNSKGKLIGAIETLQDITVRKRALESLGESEERFRTVSQQALMGILIFQDNRLKFVNNAFTRIVGYSVEELHEKYADELDQLIHEDDRQLAQELRQKLNSRDDKYLERVSWRVLTKDGEVRWVDNFAKRITYKGKPADIFSVSDITDRVRAELELESEKERLNVTLRSIGDGVIATDREHNIILFNKVAEVMTGFSEEEALGKPLQEVFNIMNDSTREKVENPVQQVLSDGTIINLSDNTVLISRDGRERSIADSGAPIRDHDGNVVGVVIVFRDITETKRLQEFASRAQRLETAGRIAGQVAHDFNNLLGPLTAYPSLIRDEIPADHIATEYVNQIEKSARQMADINQQLLTLGRRGHYALEPLNLNEIVLQVIKQLYPLTESIAVDTDLAEDLFNIRGGASQIYRVVANLVSNALDAIKETGGIRISTENFYSDRISGRYGQVPKGEYVKLTVTDSGEGIQPELMPKIFDPFFTTKMAEGRRGSGLGLSVVHSVIEDHHGYIDVSSTPGKGTSFFLYFPITRESALSPVSDKIIGGHEEILVVDDDPTQREVTRVILEKLGYRTTTAKSGEEALVIIERKSFDLMILDMIMPGGIDGAETYRRALEIRSPQKAVIVSGYAESERVDEAVRLGASLFLRKPVTIKSIAHAVR
ncbi:MAG: PAS domain S-box protein, partial [candidate division Zixibacteria bacterium]|nr:PAS domain S-box protein [candidate division Zixibacteria bacterium]